LIKDQCLELIKEEDDDSLVLKAFIMADSI